ncbi:low temperature requirement protein A [Frigidibacter sp. RF13]|uniref:low temperature requirement protein A n=1 Tax=Frigidibacter sp. RF13 TaxID=2997340 RepID=UPI0022712307|nr:low temperature requirement protein A [Frigidibacter sp. RF13]MCY1125572.1 low temperature requirement protein A [Frigidibacter sp. RF13]
MIRALTPRDPAEQHRPATTLELLYDLVSVIAIAAVTAGFHHAIADGHGIEALPRFIFLFLAIWWAWMNFTWFASAFDNDDALYRLLVLVIMGGALLFAGGAGQIFETLDFGYGLHGWIIMRIGMIGLWLRAAAGSPDHRVTALRYAGGIFIAQLAWTVFYYATEPGSTAFFVAGAFCFLVEWSVPPFAERANGTPFHRHHIIERYGLLMIISLGEIMLSIAHGFGLLYEGTADSGVIVTSAAALVIVYAIWWLYFCEKDHLAKMDFLYVFNWGYGHVFIFGATAATGAAIGAEIDLAAHHAHATGAEIARYLGAALALTYLALWFVRDRVMVLPASRRFAMPAMALVMLAAGLTGLPAWAFALLSALAVLWRTWGVASPVRQAHAPHG